jgi:hypothetical protein
LEDRAFAANQWLPAQANYLDIRAMENALLYTFSTIAQALGGMFALLAAFVLFRFQSLEAEMISDSDRLQNAFTSDQLSQYNEFRGERQYRAAWNMVKAVADEAKSRNQHQPYGPTAGPEQYDRWNGNIARHARISRWFLAAAVLTGDVIVASVAMLPFAQLLRYHPIGASSVLAIGVISFAACVVLYWQVISSSLGIVNVKKPL